MRPIWQHIVEDVSAGRLTYATLDASLAAAQEAAGRGCCEEAVFGTFGPTRRATFPAADAAAHAPLESIAGAIRRDRTGRAR